MPSHVLSVDSNFSEVPAMADRLRDLCRSIGLGDDDAIKLEICVVEAVNNVIEHGYGNKTGNWIEVSATVSDSILIAEVRDRGESLPPKALSKQGALAFDPADIDTLPERGMGLAIMCEVMDDVKYETHDGLNTLRLLKKVKLANDCAAATKGKLRAE